MKFEHHLVVKRWVLILQEYELVKQKRSLKFKKCKDLYAAHHISAKECLRYYRRWVESGRNPEGILPKTRGPRPGSRRTPKEIERNIIKAYRRFGSNRYELVLLFKPYYLDKTPSPATMDRIKARYPLNEKDKKIIRRYEKRLPGELAHIDLSGIPTDLRCSFKVKDTYFAALEDDCTRLTYSEIIKDKKSATLSFFLARGLAWFLKIYNFQFDAIMSDNGPEFTSDVFEGMCSNIGIKHIFTKPYRPQTNGKVEAFIKITKNEFFMPNKFESQEDLILNLGNFIFEYNHLRRHGGLNYQTPFDKLQSVTELLS